MASMASKLKTHAKEAMGAGKPAKEAKALGKAIVAEVDERWEGVTQGEGIRWVPVSKIAPDPGQHRKTFDPADILEMSETLMKHGQLQPIEVYWDQDVKKYLISYGERRWRGAKLAQIETLKCVILAARPEGLRIRQLVENLQRVDVPPIELAAAYAEVLMTEDWTEARLAEEVGKSEPTIHRTLALTRLAPRVQTLVNDGMLSASAGYAISRLASPEDQIAVANLAIDSDLSRDQVLSEVGSRLDKGRLPGQTSIPFAVEAKPDGGPVETAPVIHGESRGKTIEGAVSAIEGRAEAVVLAPALTEPAQAQRLRNDVIAGWWPLRDEPSERGQSAYFEGVSCSVDVIPESDRGWPAIIAALSKALDAARYVETLARIQDGPAYPGDAVESVESGGEWGRKTGVIEPFDEADPRVYIEWDDPAFRANRLCILPDRLRVLRDVESGGEVIS